MLDDPKTNLCNFKCQTCWLQICHTSGLLIQLQSHWETQHTHTRAHTHTHSTSRHYHLYTKFANSCGYSRLRSCFFRARSSELWASYLCRRFQSEIVHAKAFPRYRHLPNLSVCDSRRSPTSASLLSLFRGKM